MLVLETAKDIKKWRKENIGTKVGFVPTMGCLHSGHRSLVARSVAENDHTVVSVFVNPSQFGPGEDLDNYPKTLEADLKLLEELGVSVAFVPQISEMYPHGIPLEVEKQVGPFVSVHGLSEKLEGRTRPNFFRGVATVVTKLFNIVSPSRAYFGQKDIQQFIVLDTMAKELFMDVEVVMMPIIRDGNGLALSSRNSYLCAETLSVAANIYAGINAAAQVLRECKTHAQRAAMEQAALEVWTPYVNSGDFKLDYLSIADRCTLDELDPVVSRDTDVVISCAVYVTDRKDRGKNVRLIDNIIVDRLTAAPGE